MPPIVKVAAAQIAPVFLDCERTLAKICDMTREAAANGARLVVFPESVLPGYPYWAYVRDPRSKLKEFYRRLFEQAVDIPGPVTERLGQSANDGGCFIVVGMTERIGGTMYNTQLCIGPEGNIIGKRRKLVPTSHERMVWGAGDGRDLQVWPTTIGTVGGLVCYEHMNALYRYAMQAQGEQIHVAMWPGGMPEIDDITDAAVRHYAFEGQTFVISVTAVLTEDIIAGLGHGGSAQRLVVGGGFSAIVEPGGKYLAGPARGGEILLYADMDFARITEIKRLVDSAGHSTRPDVVRLVVNRAPKPPIIFEDNMLSSDS